MNPVAFIRATTTWWKIGTASAPATNHFKPRILFLPKMPPELIIFVGLQASGKSTYYQANFAATHVHVSKDLMKPRNRDAKQLEMIEEALSHGRSVVVDNTNPTPAVRAPLIAIGQRHQARV